MTLADSFHLPFLLFFEISLLFLFILCLSLSYQVHLLFFRFFKVKLPSHQLVSPHEQPLSIQQVLNWLINLVLMILESYYLDHSFDDQKIRSQSVEVFHHR
jgi:hypothetical protein